MATFAVAYGEVPYTPRFPPWPSLWMVGYGWDPRGNDRTVARELFAQCVVIHDAGRPHVLLRVDVAGIPRDVHQAIRQRVVAGGLVASRDFLISYSHTHSGPQIGRTHVDPFIGMNLDDADIDAVLGSTGRFVDTLVDLVGATVGSPTSRVTLDYAEGDVRLGVNRVGLPLVLTRVPVLLARRVDDGGPEFVLFGHACHPVARGNDRTFDSDFCGFAAEVISERLGAPALYFQGAAGDQDPAQPHHPALVDTLGQLLADEVLDVVEHGVFTRVTGPIDTTLIEVELPFAVDTGDLAVVADLAVLYRDRLELPAAFAYARRHAEVILRQIDGDGLPTSIPMPVQRWRFGEADDGLTVVAMAHEVLSGYDPRIRAMVDGPLWVMAFANEIGCYIPEDATLRAGGSLNNGYEAGWNNDEPRLAGIASNMMVYGWPAPLAFAADDTDPDAVSTQRIVLDAVRRVLA